MIEETFFRKLTEASPIVIFRNQLYQVASSSDTSRQFLNIGGNKFELIPSSELAELESLDRDLNYQAITKYKKEFIEERLNKEMKSAQEMKEYIGGNKTLQFILYELFPLYMEDTDEEIDAILEGKAIKEDRTEIDQLIDREVSEIEVSEAELNKLKRELLKELDEGEDIPRQPRRRVILDTEDDDDLEELLDDFYGKKEETLERIELPEFREGTRLSEALEDESVLVFKGEVYRLVPGENNGENSPHVMFANRRFNLQAFGTTNTVEMSYLKKLERQLKVEAVEEYGDQLKKIQQLRSRNKQIDKFARKGEYEMNNIGFIKRNEGYGKSKVYYVYLKAPKFAMKHPKREEYYGFESCRVGVRLNYSGGKVRAADKAVVIDKYSHPFLKEKNLPFQKLCNLTQGVNTSGFSDAEKVAKKLDDGLNNLMHGMTEKSFRKHGGTDIYDSTYWTTVLEKKLRDHKLTKRQVKKGKYEITNELWSREKKREKKRETSRYNPWR